MNLLRLGSELFLSFSSSFCCRDLYGVVPDLFSCWTSSVPNLDSSRFLFCAASNISDWGY
jgi:hypothetical protein